MISNHNLSAKIMICFGIVLRFAKVLKKCCLISNCKNHEFSKFSSEKNARSACFKLPLKVGPFQGGVAMRLGVFLQKVGP